MKITACPVCGRPVLQPARGRPKVFCEPGGECWRQDRERRLGPCSVNGCNDPVFVDYPSEGLCRTHRWRLRNGRPMDVPKRAKSVVGMVCAEPGCQEPVWARGKCNSHNRYDWAKRNPERHRKNKRNGVLRRHHTDEDWFDSTLIGQDFRCANPACRSAEPGGRGEWHIDHDHRCCPGTFSCGRCLLGLLCHKCNFGSGYFDDDPEKLIVVEHYPDQVQEALDAADTQ